MLASLQAASWVIRATALLRPTARIRAASARALVKRTLRNLSKQHRAAAPLATASVAQSRAAPRPLAYRSCRLAVALRAPAGKLVILPSALEFLTNTLPPAGGAAHWIEIHMGVAPAAMALSASVERLALVFLRI